MRRLLLRLLGVRSPSRELSEWGQREFDRLHAEPSSYVDGPSS